jgi:heat shock protein HtpX
VEDLIVINQLKTVVLLGALTAFVVAAGAFAAPSYAWAFAAVAVVMNVVMWFFSDRMVLRTSGARPLAPGEAPDLESMVADLARSAAIPSPRLYVIDADHANAFATGRNPAHGAVAVTTGLLRVLSRREVRGVIAHEIAHIRNRDVTIATVAAGLAAVIGGIANALQFSALFGGGRDDEDQGSPLGALAFALIAPIAASLVQLAISRSREFVADATAARLTGDPEALASALERLSFAAARLPAQVEPATASLYIVNPLTLGGLASLFSTHPPMEARIARLRALRSTASPAWRVAE